MMHDCIGVGRSADVYKRPHGRCVKRYHAGWEALADREYATLRSLMGTGLPVPMVYGLRAIDGRHCLEMEAICGESLLRLLERNPMAIRKVAHRMAILHAQLHAAPPPALPPLRQRLRDAICRAEGIRAETRDRVLQQLETLPDGHALCHYDFHPDNILRSEDGRDVVIDWADACVGSASADVCRTVVLLTSALPPPGASGRLAVSMREFGRSMQRQYLAEYCRLTGHAASDIALWLAPVAAARLAEGGASDETVLLALIEMGLS